FSCPTSNATILYCKCHTIWLFNEKQLTLKISRPPSFNPIAMAIRYGSRHSNKILPFSGLTIDAVHRQADVLAPNRQCKLPSRVVFYQKLETLPSIHTSIFGMISPTSVVNLQNPVTNAYVQCHAS